MKQMKIKLHGETWVCQVLICKEFRKKYGKKVIAVCTYNHSARPPKRFIHFSKNGLQISTIRHELMHGVLSYYPMSGINKSEMEEIFCDLFGSMSCRLEKIAKRIHKAFA